MLTRGLAAHVITAVLKTIERMLEYSTAETTDEDDVDGVAYGKALCRS